MSVRDIVLSWIRARYPTSAEATRAIARFDICASCDQRGTVAGVLVCKQCGCPLDKKVFSENGCPLNKWTDS